MQRTQTGSQVGRIGVLQRSHSVRASLVATVVALLICPSIAAAEEGELIVPPDNPAVDQYTETFPTPRGGKDVEKSTARMRHGNTLSARHKQSLEAMGDDGRAAAVVIEMTAPEPPERVRAGNGGAAATIASQTGRAHPNRPADRESAARNAAEGRPVAVPTEQKPPLGILVSQTTGGDADDPWFLPLALLAIIAWGAWFAWRRRSASDG